MIVVCRKGKVAWCKCHFSELGSRSCGVFLLGMLCMSFPEASHCQEAAFDCKTVLASMTCVVVVYAPSAAIAIDLSFQPFDDDPLHSMSHKEQIR